MKLFSFLFLFISLLSCRQSSKIPDDFDYGKTENGVYKNAYFDMEVPIPATWTSQTRKQMDQLMSRGNKIIEKKNKELASQIKASEVRTAVLMAVFKNKTDSLTNQFNASVMIMAENLNNIPGIKTGADYLEHVRTLMKQTNMGYQLSPGYTKRKIGGKEFDVLRITKSIGESMDVKQLYHVIIEKGFAIAVITSFDTEDQEMELTGILHGIKFR